MRTPGKTGIHGTILATGVVLALMFPLAVTGSNAQVPALCAGAANQADANTCASRKFAQADDALNHAYATLRARLDDNGQRNLAGAERAWISYRDQECNLRTGYDATHPEQNGTIMPLLISECRTDLTSKRTADLEAQLKCPGGDLSCPP